jgi:hypothetical protein
MDIAIGTIILWNSSTVPEGWHICDGTNGTPNLISRFVLGANNDADLLAQGGATNHYHNYTPTITSSNGSHSHNKITKTVLASSESNKVYSGSDSLAATDHRHKIDILFSPADDHSHTTSGKTNAADNLPLHIKLAYIMKIA